MFLFAGIIFFTEYFLPPFQAVYFGNMFQYIYKKEYPTSFDIKESEDSETFFGIFEELQVIVQAKS